MIQTKLARMTVFFTIFLFLCMDLVNAQQMDCASVLKYRAASAPYNFNEQSKSAVCYTGQKYEYSVYLQSDNEYRFSFYASTVFNNNIRFKIINESTGEKLLDLPGEAAGNSTSAILQDFFDEKQKKFVHPYFDILPQSNCSYKIVVEVGEIKENTGLNSSVMIADSDQKKGCVTIFMQSKSADNYGFN